MRGETLLHEIIQGIQNENSFTIVNLVLTVTMKFSTPVRLKD